MPPPEVKIDPPSSSSMINDSTKPSGGVHAPGEKPSGSSENDGQGDNNNKGENTGEGGNDEDVVVIDGEKDGDGDESEDEIKDRDDDKDRVEEEDRIENNEEEMDDVKIFEEEDGEECRVDYEMEDHDIKIVNKSRGEDDNIQEMNEVNSSAFNNGKENDNKENYSFEDSEGYKYELYNKAMGHRNSDSWVNNTLPDDLDANKMEIFDTVVRDASMVNPQQFNIISFQVLESSNEMKDMTHQRKEDLLPPDVTDESVEDSEEPHQQNSEPETFDPEFCYICRNSRYVFDKIPNAQQKTPVVKKKRITRPGALIQCDYCSMVYHLDCLDPPLTALPIGKWMCPNHPEKSKNISPTIGISEKNDYWNDIQHSFEENPVYQEFQCNMNPRPKSFTHPVKSQCKKSKCPTDDIDFAQPTRHPPKCINPLCTAQDKSDSVYVPTVNWCPQQENDFFLRKFVLFQKNCKSYLNSRTNEQNLTKTTTEYPADDRHDSSLTSMSPQCYPSTSGQPKSMTSTRKINSIGTSDCVNEPRVANKTLNQLDTKAIRLLAKERLQQLVSEKCYEPNCSTENMCWAALKDRPVLPVKALISPVNTKGPSIPMCYNQIWIGHGAGEFQVNLHAYGHCNFVSDKHACIYYDVISEIFELINYSEYGTYVNGKLCSALENSDEEDEDENGDKAIEEQTHPSNSLSYAVQKNANSQQLPKKNLSKVVNDPTISSCLRKNQPCKCKSQFTLKRGTEHVAVLDHGSIMQFGCLQFVFCLIDNECSH